MQVVIAAVTDDSTAPSVLAEADRMSSLLGARTEVVHVEEEPPDPRAADRLAELGADIKLLRDPVVEGIVDEMAGDGVLLGVIGCRGTPHRYRPLGSVALGVMTMTAKPLLVVPPDAREHPGPVARAVVPLEGSEVASQAVAETVRDLVGAQAEVVVVHVFEEATAPRFLDRPEHDLGAWADEFLVRHVGPGVGRLTWRTGGTARRILEVADEEDADLVVLSWGQQFTGHGAVVSAVLGGAAMPVLLLPADTVATAAAATAGT